MEEIPNIPTNNTSEPEAPAAKPLSYELDIAPGMKATVELGETATGNMIPLSQILADYAVRPDKRSEPPQNSPNAATKARSNRQSLYKKAFKIGLVLGLVLGIIGLAVFLTVGT